MALEVTRREVPPGITVLAARGRITLGLETRQLEGDVSALEAAGVTRLVFDLSGVEYMDSAGLGVLTRCAAAMRNTGGMFRVCGPNPKVQHLLRMTRLDQMIPVSATLDDACRALNPPRE